MTTPSTPGTPAQIREAVAGLIAGTSLHVDDRNPAVVIISNPARPDRGLVSRRARSLCQAGGGGALWFSCLNVM